MNTPKVSIIVPVYNVENYLRPCLDSILAQTFKDFEAVLVDDGSSDKSGNICDEYAAKDPRFVVVHKPNEGVSKARITAFEHSKGELITFIDSDDYVSSEYLEKLSKPILEKGYDMVSCDFYEVENNIEKKRLPKITGSFDNLGISDFIANHYFYDKKCKSFGMSHFLWTKMIKREYVGEGLKEGLGLWIGEDQISLFEILSNINSMCLIPDRLYYYVQHSGQAIKKYDYSIWQSMTLMLDGYQRILEKRQISINGLRIRSWIIIKNIVYKKMIPHKIDKQTFSNHLSMMRDLPYMQGFFQPLSIPFGVKDNVKYWLLKLKYFRLFYLIFNRRN